MFQSSCVFSYIFLLSRQISRINAAFHGTIFSPPNSPKMYPESPLDSTVASAVVQPPLQPSQEPIWRLDEDWDAEKNLPSNWDTKSKKKLFVFWSMDVCSSYKSLKEPTDLEERLHKEESHSEDPPPFSAPHCSPWNGPSRTLSRRKLRYWYLESSFLPSVAWRFLRPSQLAASFLCTLEEEVWSLPKIRKVGPQNQNAFFFLVPLQFMPHSEASPHWTVQPGDLQHPGGLMFFVSSKLSFSEAQYIMLEVAVSTTKSDKNDLRCGAVNWISSVTILPPHPPAPAVLDLPGSLPPQNKWQKKENWSKIW